MAVSWEIPGNPIPGRFIYSRGLKVEIFENRFFKAEMKSRGAVYSQLRVIRKQENGEPPRFFGNFLDFPVSPPLFLRRPADRQGRKALVSRNWSQHPSVSFKNH